MWNHRNNDSSSSRDGEVGWCSALSRCIDLLPCKSQHRHSMLYTIQSSDYNASMMLLCSSTLSHEERRQHRLSGTIKRQVFRLKIAPTDRQCVRVGLYVWYHCTIHPHVAWCWHIIHLISIQIYINIHRIDVTKATSTPTYNVSSSHPST